VLFPFHPVYHKTKQPVGELAIYNSANVVDGFLTPAVAYCIVLYINIYCLLPYDSYSIQ